MSEHKTTTGIPRETAAALSYVLGPISGFVILILEKDDFIRLHAMQSIVVFGTLLALIWVMSATVILSVFVPLITLLCFGLWLLLMFKAVQGERFLVPVIGEFVQKLLK